MNGKFEMVRNFSDKVTDIHEFVYSKNPPPLQGEVSGEFEGVGLHQEINLG